MLRVNGALSREYRQLKKNRVKKEENRQLSIFFYTFQRSTKNSLVKKKKKKKLVVGAKSVGAHDVDERDSRTVAKSIATTI